MVIMQSDPKVLEVRCDYKANRWLQDNDNNIRSLSALEYAWWAGDENFIELFERLGAGHVAPCCYSNKKVLAAESVAYRSELAQALNGYADGGDWSDLKPIYHEAPTWIVGMDYYLYKEGIDASKVDKVDIYSDIFRSASREGGRVPMGVLLGWGGPALCRCLSVKITPPHESASRAASKLTNQAMVVK